MKRFVMMAVFGLALAGVAGTADASSYTIDPTTGWSGSFSWYSGLAPINDTWAITVATDSLLSSIDVWDCCVAGDEFGLIVDGLSTAWTSSYVDGSGYFHSNYTDLFLSSGTHSITLELTALAPGWTSGGAYANFSSAVESVPEPSTILLLGSGLVGAGFMFRNRRKV